MSPPNATRDDLAIRPYRPDDVPSLFEAATESVATVGPWLPWCHPGYRVEEAEEWVRRQVEAFAAGVEYEFVIVRRDGRFVGGCGLNLIDRANLRANLGYWVRASEVGNGAATTAGRLLAAWAWEHTDLRRLEVLVAVGNGRSLAVAERIGAVREGVARARVVLDGVSHDCTVFSLVRPSSGTGPGYDRPPDR